MKIPVTGVTEIPMARMLSKIGFRYTTDANVGVNYIVEPGDTLMFYVSEDYENLGLNAIDASCRTYCSGGSSRFNIEKKASIGMQIFDFNHRYDPNKLLATIHKAAEKCKVPISNKFTKTVERKAHYISLQQQLDNQCNMDSLKSAFPVSEDEVFSTITAYNFVSNYIRQNTDTLPCTAQNLALHPDWIIAEADENGKMLIDPSLAKQIGFSDDFVEFYRLMHAVQFYDDFSEPRHLTDAEKQSIVNNLTKDDYKRYFEDKIQTKSNN